MFTTILALTGMLSGLGALALGWHALSSARVVGSESRALAQRAAAVSASGVDPFAVRDVAVLHYDALEEMSGARSFSLALLNSEGDGVVVTSINGRTESRTYAKAVVGGECDTLLSPEEYRVVRSARLGEGVGAAATAGSPSSQGVSSAGVRPTPPPAAREEPGSPSSRDGERGAREDAEAVDAGPVREWDEAAPAASTGTGAGTGPTSSAARIASTAPTASAVPNTTGATRENAEPAPAGPSARTARATEPVADDSREASEVMPASTSTGASVAPGGDREAPDAAPVFSNATGDQHGAPATGITEDPEIPVASEVADDGREDASVAPADPAVRPASTASTTSDAPSVAGEHANAAVTGATAAPGASAASEVAADGREGASATPAKPAVRPASTTPAASSNPAVPGGDREEQEPRGLVSVIRRTIGRVGADRRPPVAAVRSGVGAARPIASANVTVRPGPSATAAGSTGTPTTGNATAAQPGPEAPADEEAGGEGAREADAPASEARR